MRDLWYASDGLVATLPIEGAHPAVLPYEWCPATEDWVLLTMDEFHKYMSGDL